MAPTNKKKLLTKQTPEVVNIINVVNTYLKWANKNEGPRNHQVHHPSAFGDCLRKMQYQRYAENGLIQADENNPEPQMLRIWETGHVIQSRWEKYFTEMGVLRGVWKCKNPICRRFDDDGKYLGEPEDGKDRGSRRHGLDEKIGSFKPDSCNCGSCEFEYHEISVVDEELNFHGHADCILDFSRFDPKMFEEGNPVKVLFKTDELPKKPIVLDMKTCNANKFRTLGSGPSLTYEVQIKIYAHILDLEYGIIIYENKDTCATKIFQVDRDDKMWETIKVQAVTMNDMVDEKKLPPPRPEEQTSFSCRYCDFKSICHTSAVWDDPKLDEKRLKFYGDFS